MSRPTICSGITKPWPRHTVCRTRHPEAQWMLVVYLPRLLFDLVGSRKCRVQPYVLGLLSPCHAIQTVEPDTHTHLSSDAHYVKVPCSEQIINIIESPYCEVDVINETERYSASQNIERESKPYKRQNNYSSFFRF